MKHIFDGEEEEEVQKEYNNRIAYRAGYISANCRNPRVFTLPKGFNIP